jgi:bacterioferritin-associated ferredoxin
MYVCICNNVTDRDIRKAARNGAASVAELRAELGVASSCGSCAMQAQEVINEVHCKTGFNSQDLYYAAS